MDVDRSGGDGAGGYDDVFVAMVTGTSVDDFLTNADQAHNLWQQVSVSREEERVRPAEHGGAWALSAPYPNPTVFPVHLRFESASPGR